MADLQVQGLSKRYGGVVALRSIDFAASAGEVHALLGENGAGKTTLVKVLSGVLKPEAGSVQLFGSDISLKGGRAAGDAGIATVFQDIAVVPDFTVAENIFYGREARTQIGMVSRSELGRSTIRLFASLGLRPIDPQTPAGKLSVAERQIVTIVRAISTSPRLLILDEATSALSPQEVDWLLDKARSIARGGAIVLFISHRLHEVRGVADRVTVFRNGDHIATRSSGDVTDAEIVSMMLGRELGRLFPSKAAKTSSEVVLSARNLVQGNSLRGVSLELRAGEILGLGGLQGQGQSDLLRALYGLGWPSATVVLGGVERTLRNPIDAVGHGIALIPEDRQRDGLLMPKTIRENLSLPILSRISRLGFVRSRVERGEADSVVRRLAIAAASIEQPVWSLSGGNQQKVVIGKQLLTSARVWLLDDPVRGVDVGTKAEVFKLMRDLANAGYSLLFYSTDLQELVQMSDRVVVMADGAIVSELEGKRLTEEAVLEASIGAAAPPGSEKSRVLRA